MGLALVSVGWILAPAPALAQYATAGTAAFMAPPDDEEGWDGTKILKTIDARPGGELRWDAKYGRIRAYDHEEDGQLVRGFVYYKGKVVASVRAAGASASDVDRIPGYDKKKKYRLKVCLNTPDDLGYCNFIDVPTTKWEPERQEDDCHKMDSDEEKIECFGGVTEYCHDQTETDAMFPEFCEDDHKPEENKKVKAPVGRAPNTEPVTLPRGHADGVGDVTATVGTLLRWLLWFVLGACVMGFMLVGGNMALKHRRGEAGAHASGLGWVLIACVLAGSGLAMGFISLLFDPL
jgi:hypothetical protein